jgi:release factor glutamine methyltransferase
MTINDWLQTSQNKLKNAGVDSYPLDCLILLEHVTKLTKAHIIAHIDNTLTLKQQSNLDNLLNRRANREPIAYITGMKEFFKRNFKVDKSVLIPRPESEGFIELLIKHKITHQNIADVGCGSGILGITTKLELPTNNLVLSDISQNAIKIAKFNTEKLNAKCKIIKSDLLTDIPNASVILANLPYVPINATLQPELKYEPKLALFADDDGMAIYKQFWQQIKYSVGIKFVLTESLLSQHPKMAFFADIAGYTLTDNNGLVQMFTVKTY